MLPQYALTNEMRLSSLLIPHFTEMLPKQPPNPLSPRIDRHHRGCSRHRRRCRRRSRLYDSRIGAVRPSDGETVRPDAETVVRDRETGDCEITTWNTGRRIIRETRVGFLGHR